MRHLGQRIALQLLRAYKWAISPLFPPACRYVPTCSEYGMEAIERFGVFRGALMTLWRLLRCHPFAHGGYDPVERQSYPVWSRRASPPLRAVGASTTRAATDHHRGTTNCHGAI